MLLAIAIAVAFVVAYFLPSSTSTSTSASTSTRTRHGTTHAWSAICQRYCNGGSDGTSASTRLPSYLLDPLVGSGRHADLRLTLLCFLQSRNRTQVGFVSLILCMIRLILNCTLRAESDVDHPGDDLLDHGDDNERKPHTFSLTCFDLPLAFPWTLLSSSDRGPHGSPRGGSAA